MDSRWLLAATLLIAVPALAAPPAGSGRYRVEGEVRELARSADGRYALSAEARFKPAAKSADGRYALKSTTVGCDPFPDELFANGFENVP
jgi:hypothetical protein